MAASAVKTANNVQQAIIIFRIMFNEPGNVSRNRPLWVGGRHRTSRHPVAAHGQNQPHARLPNRLEDSL